MSPREDVESLMRGISDERRVAPPVLRRAAEDIGPCLRREVGRIPRQPPTAARPRSGSSEATLLSGTFPPTEPSDDRFLQVPPSSPTHSDTSQHDERRKSRYETAARGPVWGDV